MEVIKTVMEDHTLSPTEKVLFAILYCRKQGNECRLSVQELVDSVGVELQRLQNSLHQLEKAGFIRLREDCQITDATSFLTCAVRDKPSISRIAKTPQP